MKYIKKLEDASVENLYNKQIETNSVLINNISISQNFNTFKTLSIFFVIIGHFFDEISVLWIISSYGLMIFGYSSGFFTTVKYFRVLNLKDFWKRKIDRIGVNLLIINCFAIIVSLFDNSKKLFDWQTIIHFFGMSCFLEWLKIPISNSLGGGRWFLTILFLFYLIYPLLTYILQKKIHLDIALCLSVIIANALNYKFLPRPGMWLTVVAFLLGFYVAKTNLRLPKVISITATIIIFSIMLILNYVLKLKNYNFLFMFALFYFSIQWIIYLPITNSINLLGKIFSKYLIEIYLIHGLLFIYPTNSKINNFFFSLVLIIAVSIILSSLSLRIKYILKIT